MPYRLFVPRNYDPSLCYPVIITLHGAGDRGSDNVAQITTTREAEVWAEDSNQVRFPCIIVSPQTSGMWVNSPWSVGYYYVDSIPESGSLLTVRSILDSLRREFRVDSNRIYVTGLSMGGFGTWDMICRTPGLFAAAIPICGGPDSSKAGLLMHLPIWTAHAVDDGVVPSIGTHNMIKAFQDKGRSVIYPNGHTPDFIPLPIVKLDSLLSAGASLLYTEFNTSWHLIWDNIYNDPHVPAWLFSWTRPLAHDVLLPISLAGSCADSVVEQHLSARIKVVAGFAGNVYDTVTFSCAYVSLTPSLAEVSIQGIVTCKNLGIAKIEVSRRGLRDTLELRIAPSSAALDSVRISPKFAGIVAGDSQAFHVTEFYHKGTVFFTTGLDTIVTSTTGTKVIFSVGEQADSAELAVLRILKRINFGGVVPQKANWLADLGSVYSSARGYGWTEDVSNTCRADRNTENFLLKSKVNTSGPQIWRLDVPAGDYIVKIGMGDNVYGVGSVDWALYGNDTIGKKPAGIGNGINVERVTVTGNSGLQLLVNGSINYIVVISEEGVDVNAVADDEGLIDNIAGSTDEEPGLNAVMSTGVIASPNPFNPSTQLKFQSSSPAQVSIYSLEGKVVKQWNCPASQRIQTIYWNARDLNEQLLGAGVYLVRLMTSNHRFESKITFLK